MHLTTTVAIIVVAIVVIAAYLYVSRTPLGPSGGPTSEAVAADVLGQELNSATENISTSDVESAIASQ